LIVIPYPALEAGRREDVMDTLERKVTALRTLLRQARVAEASANGWAVSLYDSAATDGGPAFCDAWATYRYWRGWSSALHWTTEVTLNASPQEEIEALERFVALDHSKRQRMIRRSIRQARDLSRAYLRAAMHAVGPHDHWADFQYHQGRIAALRQLELILAAPCERR
jgi:hypothetical protein